MTIKQFHNLRVGDRVMRRNDVAPDEVLVVGLKHQRVDENGVLELLVGVNYMSTEKRLSLDKPINQFDYFNSYKNYKLI